MTMKFTKTLFISLSLSTFHPMLLWIGFQNNVGWASNIGMFYTWIYMLLSAFVAIVAGICLFSEQRDDFIEKMKEGRNQTGFKFSTYFSRASSIFVICLLVGTGHFISGAFFLIAFATMVFTGSVIKEAIKKQEENS